MTDKEYTKQLAEAYNARHGITPKKKTFLAPIQGKGIFGNNKRAIPKERRILRMDLFIIVVAFFAIIALSKQRTVTPPPKLSFSPVSQGYQLQRAVKDSDKIKFDIAGTVVFDDGSVVFNLNGKPLYPWESETTGEHGDVMWITYEKIMSAAKDNSQSPIGILECNSEYYFAAEKDKEIMFYPLSNTVRIDGLTYDQMMMIATA